MPPILTTKNSPRVTLSQEGIEMTGVKTAVIGGIVAASLGVSAVVVSQNNAPPPTDPVTVESNWMIDGVTFTPNSKSIRRPAKNATDARAQMLDMMRTLLTREGVPKVEIDRAIAQMGKELRLRALAGEKFCAYEWRYSDDIYVAGSVSQTKFPVTRF